MRGRGLWMLGLGALLGAALLWLFQAVSGTGLETETFSGPQARDAEGEAIIPGLHGGTPASETRAPEALVVDHDNWRSLATHFAPPRPVVMRSLLAWLRAHPTALRELVGLLIQPNDARGGVWPQASQAAGTEIRVHAHQIRALLARVGAEAVEPLRLAYGEAPEQGRLKICGALQDLGPRAKPALEGLVVAASDESGNDDLRVAALQTMATAEHVPADFLPRLVGALKAGDLPERVESSGVTALIRGCADRELVLETLGVLLRGDFLGVRLSILQSDALTQAEIRHLAPDLLAILDDESSDLLHESTLAVLGRIESAKPDQVERLAERLEGPEAEDWDWRLVFRTMVALEGEAREKALAWAKAKDVAIDAAHQLLAHEYSGLDEDAVRALAMPMLQGPAREDALDLLARISGSSEAWPHIEATLDAVESEKEHLRPWFRQSLIVAASQLRPLPAEARDRVLEELAGSRGFDIVAGMNLERIHDATLRKWIIAESRSESPERRNACMHVLRTVPAVDLAQGLRGLRRGLQEHEGTISMNAIQTLQHLAQARGFKEAAQVLTDHADMLTDDVFAGPTQTMLRNTLYNLWRLGVLDEGE